MIRAQLDSQNELIITPSASSASSDFDFLVGYHTVQHKKLKNRLANEEEWIELEGVHQQELILKGIGNLEQHRMMGPDNKPVEGMALRLFNPKTKLWSIFWADSRNGVLDQPLMGSFEHKVGHFYAQDQWNGKSILVQFKWDAQDAHEPKWSQAFSLDMGKTWEWNWYMLFKKVDVPATDLTTTENDKIRVIELRNYRLKQGKRDDFIHFFEKHFIQSQEEREGLLLGQYRVKDEPDRFCWLRGFYNMKKRSAFLPAFYSSEFWKKHRNATNAMIANNDDVYLLHPLVLTQGILVAGAIDRGLLNSYYRIAVVDFYTANSKLNRLKQLFAQQYIPLLQANGITDFTVWESELEENDFPQLPVFQDKNLLITFTFYQNEQDYLDKMKRIKFSMEANLHTELMDAITIQRTLVLQPSQYSQSLNQALLLPVQTLLPLQAKPAPGVKNGAWDMRPSSVSSSHDFDFLIGHHRVVHRKLKTGVRKSTDWHESTGNKTTEKLLEGIANIERHYLTNNQENPIESIAFRLFNPTTRLWSLYGADSESGVLDPPLVGSFERNVGVFYGKNQFKGQEVLVQVQYDKTNPSQPVWGQAFSQDEGKTWEWNWFMFFSKTKLLSD